MKNIIFPLFILLSLCIACSDSTEIGIPLLEEDRINYDFTDTISTPAKSINGEAIKNRVSIPNLRYVIGELNDPLFGKLNSSLYLDIARSSLPEFIEANVDSIILKFALDTLTAYGDITSLHDINVYQLDQSFSTIISDQSIDSLSSEDVFPFNPVPVGNLSTVPNYTDSISSYNPILDSIVKELPQLRIPIDPVFGEALFDTSNTTTDSIFRESFKGFVIESSPNSPSLIGLNFNVVPTMEFYYNQLDSAGVNVNGKLSFQLGLIRNEAITLDLAGSLSEQAIADGENSTSLTLQGLIGNNIEIDISNISSFENVGINYVLLELPILELASNDTLLYPPPTRVETFFRNNEGNFNLIQDENLAGNGQLNTITNTYEIRLSIHAVNYLNGLIDSPSIFVDVFQSEEIPNRVVIDNQGIKLKLVITEP